MKILICALAVLFGITNANCNTHNTKGRVTCYFNGGAVNRPGRGRYGVENIPFDKCTHVIYAFVGITNTSNLAVDTDQNDFQNFTSMKKLHPKVKMLVSVGGWDEGGAKYSHMVSTNTSRTTFVNSVVAFMDKYDFDGFDLDWEYPGATDRDGVAADKQNFLALVQELKAAFGASRQLTAAVPITASKIVGGYDVADLCKELDAVHVMTYDFHGSWDKVALPHSALYGGARDKGANEHINVHDGLQLWVDNGCPANKLVVGVSFYGRSYTLASPSEHDIGAAITGGANPEPYTESPGLWAYYEICLKLKNGGWTREWDKVGKVPYAYKDNQWVGYDDPQSVKGKMKFIKDKGYLGTMMWSIDMDDFKGVCGKVNPLISMMHSCLKSYIVPEPTTNDV